MRKHLADVARWRITVQNHLAFKFALLLESLLKSFRIRSGMALQGLRKLVTVLFLASAILVEVSEATGSHCWNHCITYDSAESGPTAGPPSNHQGPPGKRGGPGPKGDPGLKVGWVCVHAELFV